MTSSTRFRNSGRKVRRSSESIDDQVGSCKRLAATRRFAVDDSLVFTDEATSGARADRKGFAALLAAREAKRFDVVLVDDLSRLARDNYLVLSFMAELHFNGAQMGIVTKDVCVRTRFLNRISESFRSRLLEGRSRT